MPASAAADASLAGGAVAMMLAGLRGSGVVLGVEGVRGGTCRGEDLMG